jgi:hypothetical protein
LSKSGSNLFEIAGATKTTRLAAASMRSARTPAQKFEILVYSIGCDLGSAILLRMKSWKNYIFLESL